MPLVFPDIEALETSLVDQIALHPDIITVFGMGDDEMLGRKPFRSPAAAVLFAGMTFSEPVIIGHPVHQFGEMNWDVYAIAEGVREPRGGRLGSKGSFALTRAIMDQLVGFEPIFGFPLAFSSSEALDIGEAGKAVYILRFSHGAELIEE